MPNQTAQQVASLPLPETLFASTDNLSYLFSVSPFEFERIRFLIAKNEEDQSRMIKASRGLLSIQKQQ